MANTLEDINGLVTLARTKEERQALVNRLADLLMVEPTEEHVVAAVIELIQANVELRQLTKTIAALTESIAHELGVM